MQEHHYRNPKRWMWNQNRHLNTSKEPKPTFNQIGSGVEIFLIFVLIKLECVNSGHRLK
jgi:hypothetical protein